MKKKPARQLIFIMVLLIGSNAAAQDPPEISLIFYLAENSPNGTLVGTVSGSDPDMDVLTYAIVSGNEAAAFTIGASSGDLTVSDQNMLDFETNPSFDLVVEADDGNGGMTVVGITINLTNVSEPVLGLEDDQTQFSIFPNPVYKSLFIESKQLQWRNPEISVHSLDGRQVAIRYLFISKTKIKIDFDELNESIYILKIVDGENINFQRRIFSTN